VTIFPFVGEVKRRSLPVPPARTNWAGALLSQPQQTGQHGRLESFWISV
jgi:hypothetical protein